MPSFTIWLHPSEAKEDDFEFFQSQVSLIWHKNPKSCVPVPLGSLKGLQAAKGPSNISYSLEQSPEQSATPTSSPSSVAPGWSGGYYGLRRYLKALQTSAFGP